MAGLDFFAVSFLSPVLAFAGLAKLRDPGSFRESLKSYGWFPRNATSFLVISVPLVELGASASLWPTSWRRATAVGIIFMLTVFTTIIILAMAQGKKASCGCFGGDHSDQVSWRNLVSNAVLACLAFIALLMPSSGETAPLPAILSGAGAAMLFLMINQAGAVLPKYWIRGDQVRVVKQI